MTDLERQAIEKLYLHMYSRLFAYARSSLPNDALAEEAVQETFVIACQKSESFLNSPNPAGWLVITLRNVVSNAIRKQQTAQRILTQYLDSLGIESVSSQNQLDIKVIYGELAETDDFMLLVEMSIEGKSYQQMAQSRGISLATCRKRVQRARENLQKKIHT